MKKDFEENPPTFPEGKYPVIVIDLPWDIGVNHGEISSPHQGFDYPVMSDQELFDFTLPQDIAADDCMIFLWCTQGRILPLGLKLLEEWGFTYKFYMHWTKNGGITPPGFPQYNGELILVAFKGKPKFLSNKDFRAGFNAKRSGHSRKPDEFYETLNRVTPGPRIDIFGRKGREGFDVWGGEADKFDPAE